MYYRLMNNFKPQHRQNISETFENGNADFWFSFSAAERIGGVVTSTETGIHIAGGNLFDFENLTLNKVDITVEKRAGDAHYSITTVDLDNGEEIEFDEPAESLTEAFENLLIEAPAPTYLEEWNASPLAGRAGEAAVYGNVLCVPNFQFKSRNFDDEVILGELNIHVMRDYEFEDTLDHYFVIYAGAAGLDYTANDATFSTFEELLETVGNHKK